MRMSDWSADVCSSDRGAEAEAVAGGGERRQRLGVPRIEARQRARLGAVNPQEARRQRFDGVVVVRLADRSEDTLQQYRHAVADETGDRGEVERPVAALGQEGGNGGVDVGHAVDQGAVEIEDEDRKGTRTNSSQ